MRRKFEEETVETPVEEVQEESTPDSHEQFINILVEMGLSAEQAEAVHEMAMNLAEGSSEETVTEDASMPWAPEDVTPVPDAHAEAGDAVEDSDPE